MIRKAELNQLAMRYGVPKLECHLLFSFLSQLALDYSRSPILADYLNGFQPDKRLMDATQRLLISSLKDLENHFELLIPQRDRQINGAYFTPDYVVENIVESIGPKENDANLDPSCGSGAFLIGLIEYYKRTYGKNTRNIIKQNIFGADILDYNIRRTKLLLSILALLDGETLLEQDFNLWTQDSLRNSWNRSFDNVLGNPPYVKFQDLSERDRKFLYKNWTTIQNGTFNLYFAFFELGYNLLKEGGKLGFITPNSYFTSLAGEPLRKFFALNQCVTRVVDFSHKKVFDAQTYTAITFLSKQRNSTIHYDRIDDNEEPTLFLKQINTSPNAVERLDTRKWRLLKTEEQENIRTIETIGLPIGRMFDIVVGVATLKDELYFVDSRRSQGAFHLKTVEGKSFPIEKSITRSVYKISDFRTQSDISTNSRRIIVPYIVRNGVALPIPESEIKKNFPFCYAYFKFVKNELLARDKGKRTYQPFYAWGRTQGLTRSGKKILTPTFSRLPRFLIVQDENAFFTNGYGIYFKPTGQESIFSELAAHSLTDVSSIRQVQKILNSVIMQYYVAKTSVSIEGGYPCYQKNFIEKFNIPIFSSEELLTLRQLDDKNEIDGFLIRKYGVQLPSLNLEAYVASNELVKPGHANSEILASVSSDNKPLLLNSSSVE